jgi:hypothetical protein
MTEKQLTLYWREWRACKEALQALGRPCDDEVRHALQADAIGGFTKSSKKLTNDQLTRVLARFRSYSQPGNLGAQLHAENEPEDRRAATLAEIERLAEAAGIRGGLAGVSTYFQRWLRGKAVGLVDDDTLRKLSFILRKRIGEMRGKPATAAPAKAPSAKPTLAPPPATAENPIEWDGEF